MQMPIFPESTKMINTSVGVFQKDDFVYYLHNGSPVYCHAKDQLNSYRFILANLTKMGLCSCTELSAALGINVKNVQRYKQALEANGVDWFFNRVDNRGQCYKFTEDKLQEAQDLLNNGYSQKRVAVRLDVSESAVRYHLRNGSLKKNAF